MCVVRPTDRPTDALLKIYNNDDDVYFDVWCVCVTATYDIPPAWHRNKSDMIGVIFAIFVFKTDYIYWTGMQIGGIKLQRLIRLMYSF